MNLDRYVDARSPKALLGARLEILGAALLVIALALWAARDFIPDLATTRVVATAAVYIPRERSVSDLRRAFGVATKATRTDAALEPELTITPQGSSYLSVTADTPEHAKAGLAALATAVQAAFQTSGTRLDVSPNNSAVPVPNDRSKRVSFGVRVAVVLSMLAGQILLVVGGHSRGAGRAGLFAAIATPFLLMLLAAGSGGTGRRGSGTTLFEFTDFGFLLLLLAVTPVSVIVSLWLTRNPNRGRSRR